MTTPRTRSLVSLAATLALTLMFGGCASSTSRLAADGDLPADVPPSVVHFDNDARDYVHVYLVGDKREWLLARVAPGARARLRIPAEALAEDAGPLRLAVLAGERVTLRAGAEVRAASAIPQPAAAFVSQRWTFSQTLVQGQLMALPLRAAIAEVGRGH